MSTIDSNPIFKAKMRSLNLADLVTVFEGLGWRTIASFGFATPVAFNGSPVDDTVFQNLIIRPLFGDGVDPRVPSIRRLHVECYMQAVGDLHRRSTRRDDMDKPKSLEPPERLARLDEVNMWQIDVFR